MGENKLNNVANKLKKNIVDAKDSINLKSKNVKLFKNVKPNLKKLGKKITKLVKGLKKSSKKEEPKEEPKK